MNIAQLIIRRRRKAPEITFILVIMAGAAAVASARRRGGSRRSLPLQLKQLIIAVINGAGKARRESRRHLLRRRVVEVRRHEAVESRPVLNCQGGGVGVREEGRDVGDVVGEHMHVAVGLGAA